ncbi:Methyl-CpG-binding domain-containing protein 4, partial [Dichanthelium oligosanthes]
LYAVQCYDCHKWRTVPTQEEFETLRENFTKDKWCRSKRPGCSCKDPAEIEYDSSRIWVVDEPDISKAPPEIQRQVLMSDLSKMDTYYFMPTGERIDRADVVDKFLEANPWYKDSNMSASDFKCEAPVVVEETVSAWKAAKAKEQDNAGASRGQKL